MKTSITTRLAGWPATLAITFTSVHTLAADALQRRPGARVGLLAPLISAFLAASQDLWAAPRAWASALVRRLFEPGRDAQPTESTVLLNPGATTWVAKPLGRRITCESGAIWLCFDGETLDIVLEPGQTHWCAQRSALSIHALSPSVVRLA